MRKVIKNTRSRILLALCMIITLLLFGTACSNSRGNNEGNFNTSQENTEVDEKNTEGLEEFTDEVEDDFYQSIDPYNDGPITLIDTEDVSVRDVEPGTILGQFDAGDYQIQLSKPQLPDEVMSEVESYDYQWLMVKQTGGLVVDEYVDSYTLIIFFPDKLVIKAYDEDQGFAGGSRTNFGYKPEPIDDGGELIGILAFSEYDVSPTGANDDLLQNTSDDFNYVIDAMERSY